MESTTISPKRTKQKPKLLIGREKPISVAIPLFIGVLAYYFLHINYNLYYVDDTWTISNVWNFTKLGIAKDLVFIEPDEKGYNQYFGLTYYFLMGKALNILGWTKSSVFIINSFIVWPIAIVWWFILKELHFSKNVANLTVCFLPIFPPFFFAAHIGRADAMVLLIISFQLLLFIKKRYFLSAFLIGVAIEIHLMGVAGAFYLLSYMIYDHKTIFSKKVEFRLFFIKIFSGALLGIIYYFCWHYNHFSIEEIGRLVSSKKDMSSPLNNYILTYFSSTDWVSHIWEFILLIAVMVLYIKNKLYRKNRFLFILLLFLIISTFITRRENRNYLIYIFPAIILMYFYTFEQLKKLKCFTVFISIALSVYYYSIFNFNKDYHFEKIVSDIRKELKDETIPIVGIPDFWFAAMDREFISIHSARNLNRVQPGEFYFIQSDYLKHRVRTYQYTKKHYLYHYQTHLEKEIDIGFKGAKIKTWNCTRTDAPVPQMVRQVYPGWKEVAGNYLKDTF